MEKKQYTKYLFLNIIDKDPLSVLASTPSVIRRTIHGLKKESLKKPPAKGKWSIAAIVSHLTDGEIVFGYRIRKILSEPGAKIESYDQNKWADNLRYNKADCLKKLVAFGEIRKSNVELLKSLSSKEWKRFGIHAERGRETIERMVLIYAGHDMNHLRQIENIKKIHS